MKYGFFTRKAHKRIKNEKQKKVIYNIIALEKDAIMALTPCIWGMYFR